MSSTVNISAPPMGMTVCTNITRSGQVAESIFGAASEKCNAFAIA
jgi:hypothetical protein